MSAQVGAGKREARVIDMARGACWQRCAPLMLIRQVCHVYHSALCHYADYVVYAVVAAPLADDYDVGARFHDITRFYYAATIYLRHELHTLFSLP